MFPSQLTYINTSDVDLHARRRCCRPITTTLRICGCPRAHWPNRTRFAGHIIRLFCLASSSSCCHRNLLATPGSKTQNAMEKWWPPCAPFRCYFRECAAGKTNLCFICLSMMGLRKPDTHIKRHTNRFSNTPNFNGRQPRNNCQTPYCGVMGALHSPRPHLADWPHLLCISRNNGLISSHETHLRIQHRNMIWYLRITPSVVDNEQFEYRANRNI